MRRAERARLVAATAGLVFASLVAGVACQLVAGLEPLALVDEAAPDSSAPGDASVDPCAPVPPGRRGTRPAADGPPRVFAIEAADSPTPEGADASRLCELPSFDLDGVDVSCDVDAGAAVCRALGPVCDGPGGRDGELAAVLQRSVRPAFLGDANEAIRAGLAGSLIEVVGWNGTDDDAAVRVGLVGSIGTAGEDGGLPGDDGGVPPRFDGGDLWVPDRAALKADRTLAFVTSDAYVARGVLVARFPGTLPLQVGGPRTRVDVTDAVITARVARDESGEPFRLDFGRVAGRIVASDVWSWIARALGAGALSVCSADQGAVDFRAATARDVCASLDLPAPGSAAPNAPCGAVSFGFGFHAVRARRADVGADRPVLPTPSCPDAGWPPACPPPP